MWTDAWRDEIWQQMDIPWDILIIGGGITGAGIFHQAARAGLRVLLVDGQDFAFGTSSRSSKLVHGGFRYLRNRQFSVTRESVRERQRLLRQGPYLVEPLEFLLPVLNHRASTRRVFQLGVTIYDLLAPKWQHGHINHNQIGHQYPDLTIPDLEDGFYYYDAEVDDARLVLRVLQEGVQAGGKALNYTRAEQLLKDSRGEVCGAALVDEDGRTAETTARVVIQATGPWTDGLRAQVGGAARIRKQRGSHLIFSAQRLPLHKAITFFHPRDKRAMFVFPWEGVTVIGTTDLDHPPELEDAQPETFITPGEVDYMLEACGYLFPTAQLTRADVISTFSGLRPIVSSGTGNPSKESRAHSLWIEDGLVTITGGKLTTFRLMAGQTLAAVRDRLTGRPLPDGRLALEPLKQVKQPDLPAGIWQRIQGRFGNLAAQMAGGCAGADWNPLPGSRASLAEIRWAARAEAVRHLDDLLLRRTRLGLTAGRLDENLLQRIRSVVQPELGWDDVRWQVEVERYSERWRNCYYGL